MGDVGKVLTAWKALGPSGQSEALKIVKDDIADQEADQEELEAAKKSNKQATANLKKLGVELRAMNDAADPAVKELERFKKMEERLGVEPGGGGGKSRRSTMQGLFGGATRRKRRGGDKGGDIVTHLLTIRNQVKLYHWQTNRFARHKATDDLTAALDLNIDAFVESYMGRYGRPKVTGNLPLHNFSESAAKAFVERETKYLETELPKKIGKGDTDLLNLRDTILGDLTKVSYLFTLT
jgi:hypothetical protein